MEDSEPPDIKRLKDICSNLSKYIKKNWTEITYVQAILRNDFDDSPEKRWKELVKYARLFDKTRKEIISLCEKKGELSIEEKLAIFDNNGELSNLENCLEAQRILIEGQIPTLEYQIMHPGYS